MSREDHDRLTTADLVAGTDARQAERPEVPPQGGAMQQPAMPDTAMGDRPMDDARMHDGGMPRGQQPGQPREGQPMGHEMEQLAALFPPEVASGFRSRWDQVQISFVDDPREAVQQADELVAQVMKSLASNFAEQRSRLEAGIGHGGEVNTENLRMALRSYRSFFQRLLSL
ncbi:hypothetical protein ACPWT1_20015 [Ramlibacter sp. MMS24-I3-19]|uniref:hypothetical protein n=1 Tax=Ramlibacter sp. MMS24-I3-19 TaxID=3416606 RepID=UPI003D00FE85